MNSIEARNLFTTAKHKISAPGNHQRTGPNNSGPAAFHTAGIFSLLALRQGKEMQPEQSIVHHGREGVRFSADVYLLYKIGCILNIPKRR
jgi:hypothetical protein